MKLAKNWQKAFSTWVAGVVIALPNTEKTGIIKIRAASAPYGVYKHD